VSLYCEQRAEVEVVAPEDATPQQLQDAALVVLSESGGAEWRTIAAFPEHWSRHNDDGSTEAIGGFLH
jgi:hypothetical protein